MTQPSERLPRNERFRRLVETGPSTEMGRLLRSFWQPVTLSSRVARGRTLPLTIMGQQLMLYRGESGRAYLVDAHCAHRRTHLQTGWVEGEQIRCIYHGWRYDGTGQCTEMPAERTIKPGQIRIGGYPVHEYCGLVFAWLGEGTAPSFELPRKDVFERQGCLVIAREQAWPTNWMQQVENSLDAVHVSFVHQAGKVGPFGAAVTATVPDLEYQETDAGIRQIAKRGPDNVRISDWTFPNNNHIVVPNSHKGDPWVDIGIWNVPVDDLTTSRLQLFALPVAPDSPAGQRYMDEHQKYADYDPVANHDALFRDRIFPAESPLALTPAQDYLAIMGQGPIADRENEFLGESDAGIVLLRKLLWREMDALREGKPTKKWKRLDHDVEMHAPAAAE
jgi:5,5'-dehydrodivanillate O-demethylase